MVHNLHLISNQSCNTLKIDKSLAFIKIFTIFPSCKSSLFEDSFVIILSKVVSPIHKEILLNNSPFSIATIFARVWFDKLISSI